MVKGPQSRLVRVGDGTTAVIPDGEQQSAAAGAGSPPLRGDRPMKEYYIYDSEFRELKRTGATATILFAFGSACFGFALNVHLGIVFAGTLADDLKTQWISYEKIAFFIAVACYLFAILQTLSGYNQIEKIKAETSHGSEKYTPKRWYKFGIWALVFAAIFGVGFLARGIILP